MKNRDMLLFIQLGFLLRNSNQEDKLSQSAERKPNRKKTRVQRLAKLSNIYLYQLHYPVQLT